MMDPIAHELRTANLIAYYNTLDAKGAEAKALRRAIREALNESED